MKIKFYKVILGLVCVSSFSYANENLKKSLDHFYIANTNPKVGFDRNILSDFKYRTLGSISRGLNLNPKIFDKKQKFSLYVKISSKSRVGFRYKF